MNATDDYQGLRTIVETAWESRGGLNPANAPSDLRGAIEDALDLLESGQARVAEPEGEGRWKVNEWLKKAVLLSFRVSRNEVVEGGFTRFFDKVPLRWSGEIESRIAETGARIVPPATVRRGAFIGKDAVLMPSYVNIGAWVGAGTMVDT